MEFTKQNFIDTMNYIVKSIEKTEKFDKALQEYTNDSMFTGFFINDEFLTKLLGEIMGDTDDWIGYFLYERGRKFTKKHIIKDKNGKNIPFRNMNDLYNLIIK